MLKKDIISLIKSLEPDKIYFECKTFDILNNYFKNHTEYHEKIKKGLNGFVYSNNSEWGSKNYCVYIIGDNKELTPISYNFTKNKNTEKTEVNKAFRTTIEPEILNFKKTLDYGVTKCAITGKTLTEADKVHIDHNNLDFKNIVDNFIIEYNVNYKYLYQFVIIKNTKRYFNNNKLIKAFTEYHNNNTHLRFTTAKANLTKKNMFIPRKYQTEISIRANEILKLKKIVYLAMEVRTGKSFTALMTAELYGCLNVLFLTKKKAISSIVSDYELMKPNFNLVTINDESIHKIPDDIKFDLVVHDESHRFGAFPKPNKIAKIFKEKYSKLPMIFLSGTMHPESFSQIYHQFWVSDYSPFIEWKNFYKWAQEFVNVKEKYLGYATVKDYSNANKNLIDKYIKKYVITLTQKEAGFSTEVKENTLFVEMKPITYKIANVLKRDNVYEGKQDSILAETGVKLMQKLHQIYSGTIILESGKSCILDTSKADFIKDKFKNNKIGIFYKFKAEYELLKQVYGDKLTNDLNEFNSTDKNIALQIVSGREGISLKNADYLVYFNIDFSAVSYFQSKDRLTTMDRKSNNVYWIFSKGGIETNIYNSVLNKKNYTLSIFKKDENRTTNTKTH